MNKRFSCLKNIIKLLAMIEILFGVISCSQNQTNHPKANSRTETNQSQKKEQVHSYKVSEKDIPKSDLQAVINFAMEYENSKEKQMLKYGLNFYYNATDLLNKYLSSSFETGDSPVPHEGMFVMKSEIVKSVELTKNEGFPIFDKNWNQLGGSRRMDGYQIWIYRDYIGEIHNGKVVKRKLHIDILRRKNQYYEKLEIVKSKSGFKIQEDWDVDGLQLQIYEKDVPEYVAKFKN